MTEQGDTTAWLPPAKDSRCEYVARQVGVKARYGLWVTVPEKDAMIRVLDTCPDAAAPVATTEAPPVPAAQRDTDPQFGSCKDDDLVDSTAGPGQDQGHSGEPG